MINKEDQTEKVPRKRRAFSYEFKQHVVDLYEEGMSRQEIIQKYSLTPSAFDRRVSQFRTTGTFKETVSFSESDREKIALRKETNGSRWRANRNALAPSPGLKAMKERIFKRRK